MTAKKPTRTETDTFGPIEVADDKYWGAQAERSLSAPPTTKRRRSSR